MDFDSEQSYYIPSNNSKESDKRNYWNTPSDKTARDIYFCQDNSDDYSYGSGYVCTHDIGDTRWK